VTWVGVALMWWASSALEDGIGFARSSAIAVLVGLLLGVCWYLLYPRPLARRLVGPLVVVLVWVVVSGIVGEFVPDLSGSVLFTFLGILAGLALAELRATRRRSSTAAETLVRAAHRQ
jgi:hypothetical protein